MTHDFAKGLFRGTKSPNPAKPREYQTYQCNRRCGTTRRGPSRKRDSCSNSCTAPPLNPAASSSMSRSWLPPILLLLPAACCMADHVLTFGRSQDLGAGTYSAFSLHDLLPSLDAKRADDIRRVERAAERGRQVLGKAAASIAPRTLLGCTSWQHPIRVRSPPPTPLLRFLAPPHSTGLDRSHDAIQRADGHGGAIHSVPSRQPTLAQLRKHGGQIPAPDNAVHVLQRNWPRVLPRQRARAVHCGG